MSQKWYLIMDDACCASFNMAADAYLMKAVMPHSYPVLRLYQWRQPTLSIGKNQKLESLGLKKDSIIQPVIMRRSTGGQAVLHGHDLTYSIAAQSCLFGGILETYRSLAPVFLEFFTKLGLTPDMIQPSRSERLQSASAVCFTTASSYELTITGKKIIGSAQRQTSKAFLQHGSIPLHCQNIDDIFMAEMGYSYQDKMTSLEEQNCLPSIESLQEQMIDAFQTVLKVHFEQKFWTEEDLLAIQKEQDNFPEIPYQNTFQL